METVCCKLVFGRRDLTPISVGTCSTVYVRILFMAEGTGSWYECLRRGDVTGGRVPGLCVAEEGLREATNVQEVKFLWPCG